MKQGIEFGIHNYESNLETVKLFVDLNNKAAIRVYEKVDFKKVEQNENEIEMRMNLICNISI